MSRQPRLRPLLGGLTVAGALALTGCGQPEITDSDVAVAAIASQIAVSQPADQARCTATAIVKALGLPALRKAGVIDEDDVAHIIGRFDKLTASAIADATAECWDWRERTQLFAALYPVADAEDWDAYVACASKLTDQLRASVEESKLEGAGTDERTALATAEKKCRRPLGDPVAAH